MVRILLRIVTGKKGYGGVTRLLTIYGSVILMTILVSPQSEASVCHQFPWPSTLQTEKLPQSFQDGRKAMEDGLFKEAAQHFQVFIREHPDHPQSIAARFALATLLTTTKDPSEAALETIGHLQTVRRRYPESEFSPWALCEIGDLYTRLGWFPEAKGTFEQFLESYPHHPLTPGGLLGAATNFLRHQRSLEAALIFRRVLSEPTWYEFHLEAALGLADATAASKAWEQARYWYETVELERPELIRASPSSLYRRGLTELALGNSQQAIQQFLTVFNLHPFHEDAGRALNRLAELLAEQQQDVPSLWFANLAIKRFPGQEQAYAGEATILRWSHADLKKGLDAVFDGEVRHRLAELGVALPITWNEFRRRAAQFVLVASEDLAEEASFMIAESYEVEGNNEEAMRRYIHLVGKGRGSRWGTLAAESVKNLLMKYAAQTQWVQLVSFLDVYPNVFAVLGAGPELLFNMGEAYRHLQLPEEALEWYDRLLVKFPSADVREAALAHKVMVASTIQDHSVLQEAGEQYIQDYPDGRWIVDVSLSLANVARKQKNYEAAQSHYARVLTHTKDEETRVSIQRQLVRLYHQTGAYEKAIRAYQDLLQSEAATTADRLQYADVLYDAKKIEAAMREYNALIDVLESPEHKAWAQYRLALSYRMKGNLEQSKQLFAQVEDSLEPEGAFNSAIRAAVAAQNMELQLLSVRKSREENQK